MEVDKLILIFIRKVKELMVIKKIEKLGEFSQSDSKAHYNTIEVKIVWSVSIEWTNRPMG